MKVLIALLNEPGQPRSVVYASVCSSPQTGKNRVNELIDAGLVRVHKMDKRPFAELLYPTEKGKRIAELAVEMEKVLEE